MCSSSGGRNFLPPFSNEPSGPTMYLVDRPNGVLTMTKKSNWTLTTDTQWIKVYSNTDNGYTIRYVPSRGRYCLYDENGKPVITDTFEMCNAHMVNRTSK